MKKLLNYRTLFITGNVIISEFGISAIKNEEMLFLEKIKSRLFSKGFLKQLLIISKNDQSILLINILISVLLKLIFQKSTFSTFEIDIFENFLKKENIFKIVFVGNGGQFYKDFIIDNLEAEPINREDQYIEKVHSYYFEYFKNEDVVVLRNWLQFITEKIFLKNAYVKFFNLFSHN